MLKQNLQKRLKHLYVVELLNVAWLPLCFYWVARVLNQPIGPNSILSILLCCIFLVEGGVFWLLISRGIAQGKGYSRSITAFRPIRKVNLALILAYLLYLGLNFSFYSFIDGVGTFIFGTLAILEHINYFEYQLMYDNRNDLRYLRRYGRLKRSRLSRLLHQL
ncbi:MAG: hypothetical protein LPK14_15275 [Hymenobacteraceae bacterium]|nr:hypothetical protein [Hymenobacteraceae bacterium]